MTDSTVVPVQTEDLDPIETIYTGDCPSISGRSTLTFAIGRHRDTHALQLRIVANTGGGMFCDEWIEASAIEDVVMGAKELTSRSFQVLKPGRSTNTAGFVAAAIKSLGYIRCNEENTRLHERVPNETFEKVVMARMGEVGTMPASTKAGRRKPKVA